MNTNLVMYYYRVMEYHIDGFRFDLASVLCRDTDGTPLNTPPLIKVLDLILFYCPVISSLRKLHPTSTAFTDTLVRWLFLFINFFCLHSDLHILWCLQNTV
jgi:hypothetical protein